MRIALLSNDDGIDAAGLSALRSVAGELFDEVWVVAPVSQMSQIGHRVTTDTPIRYEQRGDRAFAISGTPADCIRVALASLLPAAPDWVFSGINHGGNLGRHDFAISGPVAAVREAAFQGIPGVAVSHYLRRGLTVDWNADSRLCAYKPSCTLSGDPLSNCACGPRIWPMASVARTPCSGAQTFSAAPS